MDCPATVVAARKNPLSLDMGSVNLTNIWHLSENTFNDISGILNETCLKAKQACENIPHNPFVVSFPINRIKDLFGTLYITEDNVFFAVMQKSSLYSSYDVRELTSLLKPSATPIPARVHDQISLALTKRISFDVLANNKVKDLWKNKLSQATDETQTEEFVRIRT